MVGIGALEEGLLVVVFLANPQIIPLDLFLMLSEVRLLTFNTILVLAVISLLFLSLSIMFVVQRGEIPDVV